MSAAGTAAALTDWRSRDELLFAILVCFGAVAVELTRRTTEPAGLIKEIHAIWQLPIALLLPPVYCLVAPVATFGLLQLRTRRTIAHRRAFSAAANGLSLGTASVAFHALHLVLPAFTPVRGLIWLAAAGACAVLWSVVNKTLVMTAVIMADRTVSVREQLFSREPLLNDLCEVSAGLLLAGAASVDWALILPALPLVIVLQRSFRHAQLLSQARIDAKTGLLTAAAWRAEAEVQLARARRPGVSLALGIVDVDQFKATNDAHGWEAGDTVLAAVAAVLATGLRSSDLLGRLGGEEFIFLLPDADLGEGLRVAERLRSSVAAQLIPAGSGRPLVRVTVSIGLVAAAAPASRDLTDLLTAADAALYRAKQSGRDHVCLAPGGTAGTAPEIPGAAEVQGTGDGMAREREEIVAGRKDLGRQLAAMRARVKMSQHELARRTGYSRSTVASAEAGEPVSGAFWAAVDQAIDAKGRLVAVHARIGTAVTASRRRRARQAWVARTEAAESGVTGELPGDSAVAVTDSTCPRCGELLTVTGAFRVTAVIPQNPGGYPAE